MVEASRSGVRLSSETDRIMAWWEAANYLTVAQIYLQDNPLLSEPLRPEHIKPRLLGHWGTSPGLNLVYAHLNALIRRTGQEVLLIAGPDTVARRSSPTSISRGPTPRSTRGSPATRRDCGGWCASSPPRAAFPAM